MFQRNRFSLEPHKPHRDNDRGGCSREGFWQTLGEVSRAVVDTLTACRRPTPERLAADGNNSPPSGNLR